MKISNPLYSKILIFGELVNFLWRRKYWWLIPFVAILFVVSLLINLAQSVPIVPFVYPIF